MNQLQRQIGPLKLWQWLVVAALGIGLGLIIRRRIGTSAGRTTGVTDTFDGTGQIGSSYDDSMPSTQGSVGQEGQLIDWGSAYVVREEQNRFLDELEDRLDDIFTPIKDRLEEALVPVPVPKQPVVEAPKKTTIPEKPTPTVPKAPAPTGQTYTVVKGDTLTKIAARFGYSHWRAIYDANRSVIGPNPDLIRPGQVLQLPPK